MKTKQKIAIFLLLAFVLLISISVVKANILYCLNDDESLPPGCSGSSCLFTCNLRSGSGFCQICTTDSGFPGVNPSSCNSNTCSFLGDTNSTPDLNAPNLTINSPVSGEIYDNTRVRFDIKIDKPSTLEYKLLGDSRWTSLCSSCTSFTRGIRLMEGPIAITIRAKKQSNNLLTEETILFNVDSKKPFIYKSLPEDGEFANGNFIVEYTEENLERVDLNYKGSDDINWNTISLPGCLSGERMECSADINLDQYEGANVMYYFRVCDSAQCTSGNTNTVKVDSSPPILTINTPFEEFYNEKKILFDLSVNENVDLYYFDNNDPRNPPRKRRLCSDCNIINKLVSFRDGFWNITIIAVDEADSTSSIVASFFVDTKSPRISKTEPRSGFVASPFYLEFREVNPKDLVLFYGNFITGQRQQDIDLNSCILDRNRYKCTTPDINLVDYNNQEIQYWFQLTDITNNSGQSRQITLNVDTQFPVINTLNYTIDGNRVTFLLDITENNLDEVSYIDNSDPRARERRMCSRLKDGICKKRITLREGTHDLTIFVIDDAGNQIGQEVSITI